MKHIHIDIETYCDLPLSDVGVHRYAEDESFRILLLAYSFDYDPVTVVDLTRENLPEEVRVALTDPDTLKIAHNAPFEITCLKTYFGLPIDPAQWDCTMVAAAYLGLPLALGRVAEALNLAERKDTKGDALIKYFCQPCRPTKANGGRTVNHPEDDPDEWETFKAYNAQDVRVEKEIYAYINRFSRMPGREHEYWVLDQIINAKGIAVDRQLVENALSANAIFMKEVHAEIAQLTGVSNPNSIPQLKKWIAGQMGLASASFSLAAEALDEMAGEASLPPKVARLLQLRKLASNTSISKYDAMLAYLQRDGRVRGQFQFYGANRTGRFAGRGIQVQNLKKTLSDPVFLDEARASLREGYADLIYPDLSRVISRCTRTAFVAADGCSLVSADFSAIEARVIAWLAGEEWVLDVFKTHGKIYEATAANMFNVPLEMVTKENGMRAKGKVATLALGYQGASGALVKMGALREGLTEEELPALVSAWRSANPRIVKLWRGVEAAAKHVVEKKTSHTLRLPYCAIRFSYDRGYLFIELPSGRRLAYFGATVDKGRLYFRGMDQVKKAWVKIDTYGGSLVENITQAVARDCLCEAMHTLHYEKSIPLVMHVHDECVAEVADEVAEQTLDTMLAVMRESPAWAVGLPLQGAGYVSKYYKKD